MLHKVFMPKENQKKSFAELTIPADSTAELPFEANELRNFGAIFEPDG